ncbi:MAG: Unknown protein [uncultured Campylobacterales bacterium]|uniref:TonB C-terminal domain-containing protein n=1 Tax=uncultured Campylobacterales bacterium TaxID=352960 RepID=A0A6S6SJD5_9BACT|nr:MAG: Unknown protein [uncultured Campylobacterales bacterium]
MQKSVIRKTQKKIAQKSIEKKQLVTNNTLERNSTVTKVFESSIAQKKISTDISKEYININQNEIFQAIKKVQKYPRMAKKMKIEGRVKVSFRLLKNSNIQDIKIVKSAHNILNKDAIKTIKMASLFFPSPKEDLTLVIPIVYRLN